MTKDDIAQLRLHNQGLTTTRFNRPEEVVKWLGAVQAQDYLGSLWAIGLRMKHATEKSVEKALMDKRIVRSWPMRGTLHFAAAEDLRWMLKLLTPRVIARCSTLYRQSELDKATFVKGGKVLAKVLQGGNQLERKELYEVLERAGISTAGQRGLHILGYLAQNGLLCFANRAGKQQTFALLDEWLPATPLLTKEESLIKLGLQYFTSHGPATLLDYTWWSGLAPAEAKISLEMIKSKLVSIVVDGKTYWMSEANSSRIKSPDIYLLPAYDEFTVAYKDRSAVLDPRHAAKAKNGIFGPVIVSEGKLIGTWKRTIGKNHVKLDTAFFSSKSKIKLKDDHHAVSKYNQFMEMPVKL
jgi:hypothetical protein